MTEIKSDTSGASAPKASSRRGPSRVIPTDKPEPLQEIPASHLIWELLKSGHLLGFIVVWLVFLFVVLLNFRKDASYEEVTKSAKEILVPIVTLYLGFILGQVAGKRREP